MCVYYIYTLSLKSKYVAYGNLSCLDVITHLKINYYKITSEALKENAVPMTSSYNTNQPLKTFIDQIETSVNFSDSGRFPFTPKQVATTAYDLILSTGYFTNSCRRYNSKLLADKTWKNFKTFFSDKHQIWQETQPSLAGIIYLLENALNQKTYKTIDKITLLLAPTASDRKTYLNLTTTVAYLTDELSSTKKNLIAALWDNAHLDSLLRQFRLGGRTSKKTGTVGALPVTDYFCSCGYDSGHPRFQCIDKKTGRVMNSTRESMQGGSY